MVKAQEYKELSRVLSQTMTSLLCILIGPHTHTKFLNADLFKDKEYVNISCDFGPCSSQRKFGKVDSSCFVLCRIDRPSMNRKTSCLGPW